MVGPFGMRPRTTMGARALPLAKALAARGHGVTMVLPPWQNRDDAGRRWTEGGVTVENLEVHPGLPGLSHVLVAVQMTRRVLHLRPDVVHLFKPKAYSGMTHWLLARLPAARRPRLVVDSDDWEGPGGWNDLGDYTALERRFFAWQEHWGLTHAEGVTVASRCLESLVWAMGVPPERVFYVPNGVEAERAGARGGGESNDGERRTAGVQRSSGDILLYTRFFEFPVTRVVEVLLGVRERIPDARLLIVGEGLFGEEEELFRLAAEAGLKVGGAGSAGAECEFRPVTRQAVKPDIVHAGWVPMEKLPAYFAEAAVAIYPFDDTLVNRAKCAVKLRDLLAAGVPVVAEAVGQNREYIKDGETGLLVEPADVPAFVDAVTRVLITPGLGDRLGRAAARDLRERFSWDRMAGVLEQAYRVRT